MLQRIMVSSLKLVLSAVPHYLPRILSSPPSENLWIPSLIIRYFSSSIDMFCRLLFNILTLAYISCYLQSFILSVFSIQYFLIFSFELACISFTKLWLLFFYTCSLSFYLFIANLWEAFTFFICSNLFWRTD